MSAYVNYKIKKLKRMILKYETTARIVETEKAQYAILNNAIIRINPKDGNFKVFYVKDVNLDRERGEEEESGGSARYGLPYGLCKMHGIDPTGMSPKEAWGALKGEGVSPAKAYSDLEEEGKVTAKTGNIKQENPEIAEQKMTDVQKAMNGGHEHKIADFPEFAEVDVNTAVLPFYNKQETVEYIDDYIEKHPGGISVDIEGETYAYNGEAFVKHSTGEVYSKKEIAAGLYYEAHPGEYAKYQETKEKFTKSVQMLKPGEEIHLTTMVFRKMEDGTIRGSGMADGNIFDKQEFTEEEVRNAMLRFNDREPGSVHYSKQEYTMDDFGDNVTEEYLDVIPAGAVIHCPESGFDMVATHDYKFEIYKNGELQEGLECGSFYARNYIKFEKKLADNKKELDSKNLSFKTFKEFGSVGLQRKLLNHCCDNGISVTNQAGVTLEPAGDHFKFGEADLDFSDTVNVLSDSFGNGPVVLSENDLLSGKMVGDGDLGSKIQIGDKEYLYVGYKEWVDNKGNRTMTKGIEKEIEKKKTEVRNESIESFKQSQEPDPEINNKILSGMKSGETFVYCQGPDDDNVYIKSLGEDRYEVSWSADSSSVEATKEEVAQMMGTGIDYPESVKMFEMQTKQKSTEGLDNLISNGFGEQEASEYFDKVAYHSVFAVGDSEYEKISHSAYTDLNTGEVISKNEMIRRLSDSGVNSETPHRFGRQPKISANFGEECYTEERKNHAFWADTPTKKKEIQSMLGAQTEDAINNSTPEQLQAAVDYTGGSGDFNKPLRTGDISGNPDADVTDDIENLDKFIENTEPTETDMWVQRGVHSSVCDYNFGFALGMTPEYDGDAYINDDEALSRIAHLSDAEIENMVLSQDTVSDAAYMSCSPAKGHGFNEKIIYNIYCPAGTKGTFAENYSQYSDTKEFEYILARGSQFRPTKCEVVRKSDGSIEKVFIDLDLIAQP